MLIPSGTPRPTHRRAAMSHSPSKFFNSVRAHRAERTRRRLTRPHRVAVLPAAAPAVAILVLLAFGSPRSAECQATRLGARTPLPATLRETSVDGRFSINVVRSTDNAGDQALIEHAERILPSPNEIVSSASTAEERLAYELASSGSAEATSAVSPTPRSPGDSSERWWTSRFDGTWLPFAVTGSAVRYYIDWTRDIAAYGFSLVDTSAEVHRRAEMNYTATVLPSREHGAARLVQLELAWSFKCGVLCGVSIRHSRRVWFDRDGLVVRVEGDRRPSVVVS